MEDHNEKTRNDAISVAESQLIALIAAIAIEQVIAEKSSHSHSPQQGTAA